MRTFQQYFIFIDLDGENFKVISLCGSNFHKYNSWKFCRCLFSGKYWFFFWFILRNHKSKYFCKRTFWNIAFDTEKLTIFLFDWFLNGYGHLLLKISSPSLFVSEVRSSFLLSFIPKKFFGDNSDVASESVQPEQNKKCVQYDETSWLLEKDSIKILQIQYFKGGLPLKTKCRNERLLLLWIYDVLRKLHKMK